MTSYLDRLGARTRGDAARSCAWASTPTPRRCPTGFPATVDGVERFARLLIEATLPYAAAVKPNLAFFEALGSAGIAALERLRAAVPADVPFIADAKRGDIGSTAARQAVALFDVLGADAVTVSPYLGEEAIAPLLEREDRFAYVLCRTSNPGAGELQALEVAGDPSTTALRPSRCGLGSRGAPRRGDPAAPSASSSGRRPPRSSPRSAGWRPGLAFLVPGVGAQGGEVEPVLEGGPATAAPGGGGAGRRPARQRLARHRPGGAGGPAARRERAATTSAGRDPGERLAAAAAEWAKRLAVLP